ncbi:MAG: ABC transporter substrate-binding protein [Candidatus Rokubacteria bacterium]|nr:ABC transporter substrate-binding protein [Candidatus Rokubacteria bacterium]
MIRIRYPIFVLAGFLAILAPRAWAGTPTESLKTSIEKIIPILQDPALKGDSKSEERRAAIRAVASEIFDFTESARRCLGRHWESRSDQERQEFTRLFGGLLERTYITKLESYAGEQIAYTGETVNGDLATVRTKILTKKGSELPVDYQILRRGNRWVVYDVLVDGVSFVANYRAQFNKIIQTSSYEELVKQIKTKQERL